MSKVFRTIALRTKLSVKTKINGNIRCISFVRQEFFSKNLSSLQENASKRAYAAECLCSNGRKSYSTRDLPPHNRVLLPALSPTMEMGTIISWTKKEGDRLSEGDLLAEIETDKATMGFETPEEGYLAKILVAAGTKDVPIGKLVCIIVENESDVAFFKDYKDDVAPKAEPTAKVDIPKPPPASPMKTAVQPPPQSSPIKQLRDRVYASPLARRLASEQGFSLDSIGQGSGLYGSITAKDLKNASAGVKSSTILYSQGGYEDKEISSVRKVIAKRLLQSKQTIPHYYLTMDLKLDEINKLRAELNENLKKEGGKLTLNDFVIKATALACKKIPEANSAWMDTFIRQYHSVDVSVAVSTERGLITPIVSDADVKGLLEISSDVKRLAAKAREGTLTPEEFQGGTISVSNLGMFKIKSVSSIINPPQACILGIGSIQKTIIPDSEAPNGMRSADVAQFTLSCDHRVVDGAVGAQWFMVFQELIEHPHNMLL